ncbi:MAG: glycosyltransferase [Terriglobia bacterium]|jgi:glycosyltransferase involved in cell wall biosynthesis
MLNELVAALRMLRFLTQRRPCAVICGGYDSLAAWVTFLWCKLFDRRFVLWLEATIYNLRRRGSVRTCLKKFIISRADAIAASGKATVDYVRTFGVEDERIYVAPFGGDNEWYRRGAAGLDVEDEKHRRGYPRQLILYSGRLVRAKGVYVLLQAFKRVSSELPEVGLLIVGDGSERHAMESFCWEKGLERVFFVGGQEYEQMPRFFALADLLVLPTFYDTWGWVVNEAFACGVPAIVSRVAGACADLVIEGETGFTVEPGDAGELATKILRLMEDDALRAKMGANCGRLIEKYSAEACAEGLLAAALGKRNEVRL